MSSHNSMIALRKSVTKSVSLADRAKAARNDADNTILMLDSSYSMSINTVGGNTRISSLWEIVQSLRAQGVNFRPLSFGDEVQWCEVVVPTPAGGTPLTEAFEFILSSGKRPSRIVLITDGEPDNAYTAHEAGQALGCPINVFFVGDAHNEEAKRFCFMLAQATGGQYAENTISSALLLAEAQSTARLMLTAGDDAPHKPTINL